MLRAPARGGVLGHLAALWAVLSLVGQGLLAAWLMPPLRVASVGSAPAMAGAGVAGPLRIITICSGLGIRRIWVDADGNPVAPGSPGVPDDKAPAPGQSAPTSCHVCTSLARFTPLAPAMAALPMRVALARRLHREWVSDRLAGHRPPRPKVRDPPVPV